MWCWRVYQITFENGDRYVGCTSKTIDERIYEHVTNKESIVGKRILDDEAYSVKVLCIVSSKEEGLLLESIYIKKGNPYGKLINKIHNKWFGQKEPHYDVESDDDEDYWKIP